MNSVIIDGSDLFSIGLGTWHMGENLKKEKEEIHALQIGLNNGISVIDTAEMYGDGASERLIKKAIRPFRRTDIYLISKVYPWNASKKQLQLSLDNSLKRLGTDYLDLYLLHWPGSVPLKETVEALEFATKQGKIKAWGVSNFDVKDLKKMYKIADSENCQVNEVLYNLGERGTEYDLQPYMEEKHLPLIAYSPVAQGDSLGNSFDSNKILNQIAEQHQATIFQILLSWVIRHNNILAIPQSGNEKHVLDNIQAAKIQLTKDELELLDQEFPPPTSKKRLAIL